MAIEKNLRITINFYIEKLCFRVITWNRKHLSKQLVPTTYILEKTYFAVASFEVSCFFSGRVKNL